MVCRLQQDELGTRRCDFPLEACLWFSYAESGDEARGISHEQALAALDEAERVGLVHTVSNVASGIGYVCNCCGCCCGLLRGINEWGIDHSVAQANYFAEIDPVTCTACGTCQERCQVDAIAEREDGVRVVSARLHRLRPLRHRVSRRGGAADTQARRRDRGSARHLRRVGASAAGARGIAARSLGNAQAGAQSHEPCAALHAPERPDSSRATARLVFGRICRIGLMRPTALRPDGQPPVRGTT